MPETLPFHPSQEANPQRPSPELLGAVNTLLIDASQRILAGASQQEQLHCTDDHGHAATFPIDHALAEKLDRALWSSGERTDLEAIRSQVLAMLAEQAFDLPTTHLSLKPPEHTRITPETRKAA